MNAITLRVCITREDIDLGERCVASRCAVARAIARALAAHPEVAREPFLVASASSILVEGFREEPTPPHVGLWIELFDSDRRLCEPLEFTIRLARIGRDN